MKLVELGARSMDFVDLEFLELGCLARKKWSGAIFVDLELRGALPNTPLTKEKRIFDADNGFPPGETMHGGTVSFHNSEFCWGGTVSYTLHISLSMYVT
jgi:hypothetical protein